MAAPCSVCQKSGREGDVGHCQIQSFDFPLCPSSLSCSSVSAAHLTPWSSSCFPRGFEHRHGFWQMEIIWNRLRVSGCCTELNYKLINSSKFTTRGRGRKEWERWFVSEGRTPGTCKAKQEWLSQQSCLCTGVPDPPWAQPQLHSPTPIPSLGHTAPKWPNFSFWNSKLQPFQFQFFWSSEVTVRT